MSVANPDDANDLVDAMQEERRTKRKQASDAEAQIRRLQKKREQKKLTVRVDGEPVKFTPLSGKESDWVEDLMGEYGNVDEDDIDDGEEWEQYLDMRERTTELLAKRSKNDLMDVEFWRATYPAEERYRILGRVKAGGEEAEDRDGFR